MFVFVDPRGAKTLMIQPEEIATLMMEADAEFWTGPKDSARLEWEGEWHGSGADRQRILMITFVPQRGFELKFLMPRLSWLNASQDPDASGSTVIRYDGEELDIPHAHTVTPAYAVLAASDFLKDGMPSRQCNWLLDGKPVDPASCGFDPLEIEE